MLEQPYGPKSPDESWPELPYDKWKDTYQTLHMWTQIVGKIELELNPTVNHWWETALLVTPSGLETYPMYFREKCFKIEFDFCDHLLKITTSHGHHRSLSFETLSVSEFYFELMKVLSSIGVNIKINTLPQEVENPIPFPDDKIHHSYNRKYVTNFHKILLQCDRIMKIFRGGFLGKSSPVHFFWGSFDMAVTRFSGRVAPNTKEMDSITKEAYSHEVISAGFWPGSMNILEPAFYVYAAPEPRGFDNSELIRPKEAFYNKETKGYILKYNDVRKSHDPDKMVLDFFDSTYQAGASLGGWDRLNLERKIH